MEEENTTLDYITDESQLNSAAVEEAVSEAPAPEQLTLAELNHYLGKDFKDKATALKSVKDTYSYVGKRREDIAKEVAPNTDALSKELKEIKDNMFYKDNPDFLPYRNLIGKMGSNPAEVTATDDFKSIFEKAKGFDDSQKLKSVLQSNPRLSSSKDNLTKAREAADSGDRESAELLATRAVMDLLE